MIRQWLNGQRDTHLVHTFGRWRHFDESGAEAYPPSTVCQDETASKKDTDPFVVTPPMRDPNSAARRMLKLYGQHLLYDSTSAYDTDSLFASVEGALAAVVTQHHANVAARFDSRMTATPLAHAKDGRVVVGVSALAMLVPHEDLNALRAYTASDVVGVIPPGTFPRPTVPTYAGTMTDAASLNDLTRVLNDIDELPHAPPRLPAAVGIPSPYAEIPPNRHAIAAALSVAVLTMRGPTAVPTVEQLREGSLLRDLVAVAMGGGRLPRDVAGRVLEALDARGSVRADPSSSALPKVEPAAMLDGTSFPPSYAVPLHDWELANAREGFPIAMADMQRAAKGRSQVQPDGTPRRRGRPKAIPADATVPTRTGSTANPVYGWSAMPNAVAFARATSGRRWEWVDKRSDTVVDVILDPEVARDAIRAMCPPDADVATATGAAMDPDGTWPALRHVTNVVRAALVGAPAPLAEGTHSLVAEPLVVTDAMVDRVVAEDWEVVGGTEGVAPCGTDGAPARYRIPSLELLERLPARLVGALARLLDTPALEGLPPIPPVTSTTMTDPLMRTAARLTVVAAARYIHAALHNLVRAAVGAPPAATRDAQTPTTGGACARLLLEDVVRRVLRALTAAHLPPSGTLSAILCGDVDNGRVALPSFILEAAVVPRMKEAARRAQASGTLVQRLGKGVVSFVYDWSAFAGLRPTHDMPVAHLIEACYNAGACIGTHLTGERFGHYHRHHPEDNMVVGQAGLSSALSARRTIMRNVLGGDLPTIPPHATPGRSAVLVACAQLLELPSTMGSATGAAAAVFADVADALGDDDVAAIAAAARAALVDDFAVVQRTAPLLLERSVARNVFSLDQSAQRLILLSGLAGPTRLRPPLDPTPEWYLPPNEAVTPQFLATPTMPDVPKELEESDDDHAARRMRAHVAVLRASAGGADVIANLTLSAAVAAFAGPFGGRPAAKTPGIAVPHPDLKRPANATTRQSAIALVSAALDVLGDNPVAFSARNLVKVAAAAMLTSPSSSVRQTLVKHASAHLKVSIHHGTHLKTEFWSATDATALLAILHRLDVLNSELRATLLELSNTQVTATTWSCVAQGGPLATPPVATAILPIIVEAFCVLRDPETKRSYTRILDRVVAEITGCDLAAAALVTSAREAHQSATLTLARADDAEPVELRDFVDVDLHAARNTAFLGSLTRSSAYDGWGAQVPWFVPHRTGVPRAETLSASALVAQRQSYAAGYAALRALSAAAKALSVPARVTFTTFSDVIHERAPFYRLRRREQDGGYRLSNLPVTHALKELSLPFITIVRPHRTPLIRMLTGRDCTLSPLLEVEPSSDVRTRHPLRTQLAMSRLLFEHDTGSFKLRHLLLRQRGATRLADGTIVVPFLAPWAPHVSPYLDAWHHSLFTVPVSPHSVIKRAVSVAWTSVQRAQTAARVAHDAAVADLVIAGREGVARDVLLAVDGTVGGLLADITGAHLANSGSLAVTTPRVWPLVPNMPTSRGGVPNATVAPPAVPFGAAAARPPAPLIGSFSLNDVRRIVTPLAGIALIPGTWRAAVCPSAATFEAARQAGAVAGVYRVVVPPAATCATPRVGDAVDLSAPALVVAYVPSSAEQPLVGTPTGSVTANGYVVVPPLPPAPQGHGGRPLYATSMSLACIRLVAVLCGHLGQPHFQSLAAWIVPTERAPAPAHVAHDAGSGTIFDVARLPVRAVLEWRAPEGATAPPAEALEASQAAADAAVYAEFGYTWTDAVRALRLAGDVGQSLALLHAPAWMLRPVADAIAAVFMDFYRFARALRAARGLPPLPDLSGGGDPDARNIPASELRRMVAAGSHRLVPPLPLTPQLSEAYARIAFTMAAAGTFVPQPSRPVVPPDAASVAPSVVEKAFLACPRGVSLHAMEVFLAAVCTARWPYMVSAVEAAQHHLSPTTGSVRAMTHGNALQRLMAMEMARAPAWKLLAPRAFRARITSLVGSIVGNAVMQDVYSADAIGSSPYHNFSMRASGQPISTAFALTNVSIASGSSLRVDMDEYMRPVVKYASANAASCVPGATPTSADGTAAHDGGLSQSPHAAEPDAAGDPADPFSGMWGDDGDGPTMADLAAAGDNDHFWR